MNTKSNSHNLAAMIPVERVQKIPGHVESWSIWFIRKSSKISGCLSFYTKLFLISCVCVFFLLILFCCCCCFFYFKWYYLKILNFSVYINVNLLPYVLLWMLKLDPHLLKKLFYLLQWKPFKNYKKHFLFRLKSFFHSQYNWIFIFTFWSCRKNGLIRKIRLISKFVTRQSG